MIAAAGSTLKAVLVVNSHTPQKLVCVYDGEDAGDMGFDEVNTLMKQTEETGWDDLILSKLNNL